MLLIGKAKIDLAIHECLQRCYASPSPFLELSDFLSDLDDDPTWNESEIERLVGVVRKILRALPVESRSA